jgi:hypothetical protein
MIRDPRVFVGLSPASRCLIARFRLYSYLILIIYSPNIIIFDIAQIAIISCKLSAPFFSMTRTLNGTFSTSIK